MRAGITEQCSKVWGEAESRSSGECERHHRQEQSCNKKSQVQEREGSGGGGKRQGLQGRLVLELEKWRRRRSGRQPWTQSLAGVGWVTQSCVQMRGGRATSCPYPSTVTCWWRFQREAVTLGAVREVKAKGKDLKRLGVWKATLNSKNLLCVGCTFVHRQDAVARPQSKTLSDVLRRSSACDISGKCSRFK